MTKPIAYTTQLQAGLGLVLETQKLLAIWEPGMSGQDLLKASLATGAFPTMAARRLRNLIIEAFCPRFLVEGAAPARLMKALSPHIPKDDFRALCFVQACRANPILGDFVRQVFWPRYSAGGNSVSKEDSMRFVSSAVSNGLTTSQWSESTIIRMARYLLGACADFGLLGPMKKEARTILSFHLSSTVALVLSHELHFRGVGDNAMLASPEWSLFGMDADDVLGEMKRLALQGEMIVQSAGTLAQISWKYRSMEELADGLAQG